MGTVHPSHPHTPGLGGKLNGLIDAMARRLSGEGAEGRPRNSCAAPRTRTGGAA
jgi:hypothetical protein